MEQITEKDHLRSKLQERRRQGESIAFVPTMGFLHDGHRALMQSGRRLADILVVSIFVNPTQFGPGEDLLEYPQDMTRDKAIAAEEGVDYLFTPESEAMYGEAFSTYVDVGKMGKKLCGAARKGHFRGVTTVLAKLFNVISPDFAVFGEKDFQQLQIVRKMVLDLDYAVEIVPTPIVRARDGTALGSRNKYLDEDARKAASALNRALRVAQDMIATGEIGVVKIRKAMQAELSRQELIELEYLTFCEPFSLETVREIQQSGTLIALAARVGGARLIDNAVVHAPK